MSAAGPAEAGGPPPRRRWLRAALPTLAVFVLWFAAGDRPPLDLMESATLDLRYRLRGPVAPGDGVAVVAVDDRSLRALGAWPPPRDRLADAVDALDRAGAAVIVLDLLLAERTASASPDADRGDGVLAGAMQRAGTVVLPVAFLYERSEGAPPADAPPLAGAAYRVVAGAPGDADLAPAPDGAVLPAPRLAAEAAAIGHVTVLLDDDGTLRRDLLALPYGGALFPSAPVAAVRLADGVAPDRVVVRLGEGIAIGERWVPTGPDMALKVDHYGPRGTIPTYSFLDLIEGRVPAEALAGRVVVLGAGAAGLGDAFDTPYARTLPGAEHLATVTDNLMTGRWLDRRPWTKAVDLAAILMLGLATAAAWRLPPGIAAAIAGALAGGWIALASAAFVAANVWIGIAGPALAILVSAGAGGLATARRERRRAREVERLRQNLAHYFPPAVAERLSRTTDLRELERSITAAVVFVDMVGFTRQAEALPADAALDLLRAFHRRVERAVFAHGGVIDKYLGDGALAGFGVLEPAADAAADALAAARDIVREIDAWNAERAGTGQPPVRLGIGVQCGPVLVGNVGGERVFQFTMTGDTVNVASRLEGMTRELDAAIVAGAAAIEAARASAGAAATDGFTEIGEVPVRGREGKVAVWAWGQGAR
ncbi:MAG: adenylate/guanylate cyclase domain-containing protein [Azospirillaceae bacterium]